MQVVEEDAQHGAALVSLPLCTFRAQQASGFRDAELVLSVDGESGLLSIDVSSLFGGN
jgi:hypothetical protein